MENENIRIYSFSRLEKDYVINDEEETPDDQELLKLLSDSEEIEFTKKAGWCGSYGPFDECSCDGYRDCGDCGCDTF